MKKKKLLWIIPVAVLLVAVLVVGIGLLLNRETPKSMAEIGDIFYKNELLTVGADPDVIYISEGEDAGYYYMYVTSDDLHGSGFLAYKSRDLVEWVCAGVALRSGGEFDEATGYTTVSYAFSNYWAPEVIYDANTKLYYMFYTANRYDTGFESDLYFFGDIAVSESPAGPFVQYNKYIGKDPVVIDEQKKILAYEPVFDFSKMNPDHPLYETESEGYMKVIDLNPFVDPVSGKKYVYFCHDLSKQQAISESNIYVMALQDDYMPDYTNIQVLTSPNCLEVDGNENTTLNEGSTNEAPYVIYNAQSGKYYLLFSANAYYQKTYCVRVAVGDSPEGPFRKLTQKEGGYLLYADSHWTWASGTGHCSVVNRDGQDYIVYHAHLDRVNGNSKRGIAMDELNWVENEDGLLVPVANGPSAALMPLTTYLYENVAGEAKITADNIAKGKADAMIDGIISHRDSSFIQDAVFDGDTDIKLTFKEPRSISGIAVYNSYDYDYLYSNVDSIRLHLTDGSSKLFKDMDFDWGSYYTEEGYVIPGGSVAITFDPVKVESIEISMPDAGGNYAISEIAVMARREDRQELAAISGDSSWAMEAPADDTVEFDGIVNPEEYKGDKISFADTNGVTMTMYSKMAEDGIFFGFHSNDTNVFVNPEHAIFQNSSVEIQLGKGGSDKLNANVIQLRYGLDGSIEGWIGVDSTENYQYMRTYIETVSKVHIYGQLNSADCTGYDVEAYVPYSALNMIEKPESLICAPSFNTRKDFDASGRTTWTLMVGSSFQDPTSWYRIDSQGQTVMTDGFRVQENQITQTGGSNQFYYFDDELSDAYYVNVDIQVGDILNGDRYPKFGVVSKSLDSLLAYYVDYAGGNVNGIGRVSARTTEFIGTAWEWETGSSKTFGTRPCVGLAGDGTINLELIRYENQIVMLVNGRMVMSDVDVKGLQDGSIPGLFFFNTAADITVNAYQTDKQLVQYYMANYQPEIAIDGDLGDWAAKTQLATETDSASGNAMTVYGYQTPAGVYLAYEVKHGYQPKVYMWNEGQDKRGVWYYNTNAEFWINDIHFAATAFGDSGYMVKSMATTEDLVTGTFTTVTEVFVPREVIGSGDAAVGFAFKTCDKDYSNPSQITDPKMKFRGDPWWYFKGHFPTDMAQRFILKNATAETTKPSQQTGNYAIKVLPTANGSVTLSNTEAQAGQTITLTLTPDKGYELISLTANGKPCDSKLVMPGENLYIVARFGLPDVKTPTEAPKVYPQGTFFGSAGDCHSSDVLNMKTDSGTNPYLVMDAQKGTPLYAYVKNTSAKQFYLELTAQVTGIRGDEKYPKFGLMTNDGKEMVKIYLDMATNKVVGGVGAVHQKNGKGDDWAGQSTWTLQKKLDLSAEKVTLGLLRNGSTYYFYVDGVLVATASDLSNLNTAMGIFSFGTSLKVTNYKLVKTGTMYEGLLSKAKADAVVFYGAALTQNYFTKALNGAYLLATDSDAQHLVDDVISAGKVMRESRYSLKGKLSLTDADIWGQARILVSADPRNEYFIALEKVGKDSYQIFTMSKANEENWNDWRIIAHAEVNGSRNSLDFEVIVNEDTLYFLVDDTICYSTDRVPMSQSTVKFTGYNVATTKVEGLSLRTFTNDADIQKYLYTKQDADYVSRFQDRMDSLYNEYITEHGCANKGGTLIFGDSYMDFWGSWESQTGLVKYETGYNVGIGGSAIRDWLLAYDRLVKPFAPERIILNIGYNDINVWGDNGQEFAANLKTLLEKLHADFPKAEIYYIFINPSPSVYANGAYTNAKIEDAIIRSKALVAGLDYVTGVDLFDLMTTADGKDPVAAYYVSDNIHLSEEGYKVLSGHLYDMIFGGETFGAAGGYTTTNGFDLSADKGQDPTIQALGGAPQYAYVRGVYGDKFCFETEINVQSVLNNDAWPKFGLLVNGSSEMVKFFVDMTPQLTATQVGVVYQPTGGGDDWAGSKSYEVPGMSFAGSDTIRLKLVRDGRAYYFFVNDTLVMYNENGFRDTEGAVGIFSFNTVLTASKYQVAAGENAQTQIEEAKAAAALLTKLSLTCNWFADQGDGKFTLTTNSNAEHMVDDLTRGGQVLRAKYYSVKGKLTLANAGDWGQARILISADAKNEYFIALEKTNTGKYQIFTMSKANQTGWDAWELILHQDTNGTRNSIDFEILVIGNKLYFLIEDQVVYTSTRVPMTESTVKFTGYNTATTTVENLSAEVFASKQEAEAYLADKSI